MSRVLSFSETDLRDMVRRYDCGHSTAEIAKHYDCLAGSVWARLKKRGVRMRDFNYRRPRISVHSDGYIVFDGRYVHRIVAEAWLDRELLPGEVVHHRDGDKTNNHPDNLRVFGSNTEHMLSCHHPGYWTPEMDTLLIGSRAHGVTAKKVALTLGVNENAVNKRAQRLIRRGLTQKLTVGRPPVTSDAA